MILAAIFLFFIATFLVGEGLSWLVGLAYPQHALLAMTTAARNAPLMLAVGFTGGRLDHELAAYSALLRFASKSCIIIGPRDLVFHAPPELRLDLKPGSRLALFPLAPVTGRSEGLLWPIDGLDFAAGGRLGTSNTVTGPVRLQMDAPGMLVILPRAALRAAIDGLTAAPDR